MKTKKEVIQMVSTRTINRQRKVEILRHTLNDIVKLLLLEHRQRDNINMRHFKELNAKVKDMLEMAR